MISTPRGKTTSRILAALQKAFPGEARARDLARAARVSRATASTALRRLENASLATRGGVRGSWRAWADPGTIARTEPATPSLHAIQMALPYLPVRGGLSPSRATLSNERSLTLQDGLASVSATKAPLPVAEWPAFLEEVRVALGELGVQLDDERARLVTFELNADFESWKLRGVENVRLQLAPDSWAQVYMKTMPDERRVMRAEVRASPKGASIKQATRVFEKARGLSLLEAVALARALVASPAGADGAASSTSNGGMSG